MKLNIFTKDKEPDLPPMLSQQEIQAAHDLLAAIVTGQTPIRFKALKKNEINPLRMAAEVLAFVLKLDHGKQVGDMITHLRNQLEEGRKQHEEQEKAIAKIEEMSTPPMIVPAKNGGK